MGQWAIAYAAAALVMGGLDFCWLSLTVNPIYHKALGPVMADKPNMVAAVAFYVVYVAGIVLFAVRPALQTADWKTAILWGALFGFFAYATYDLTNLATLRVWSLRVSLIDIAWGALVTAIAAGASAFITLALEK